MIIKKKLPIMLVLIMSLQIILPITTVIWESKFTVNSIGATTLEATDSNGITWTYELEDNKAINVKPKDKNSLPTEVTIPEKLDGYSVTSIGNYAFLRCTSLTSVAIPNSVISIGYYAFCGYTSLTSINVDSNNKNYTSENGVLFNKEKTEIICYPEGKKDTKYVIPEGVTSIGNGAFTGCTSLTSIEIPEGVTSIGSYAFNRCTSLTNIEIPEGVTSIGSYAFDRCTSLISIEIPNSVTIIKYCAFSDCTSLISIEIPDSVSSIGNDTFERCTSLTSINVDSNNKNYTSENGVLFNKEKTEIICYPKGKTNTKYVIPEGVTSIGNYAFEKCTSLTNIKIPDSVTIIKHWAFGDCISLTSIEIPNSVTSIEYCAFSDCTSLTSIKIPDGVTSIENYAFDYCDKVTIVCNKGSYAENYAKNNEIKYEYFGIIGDANGDGKINFSDILTINKHRLGKAELTGAKLFAADVNNDGVVDFKDMLKINKYRLGKIDSL